MDVSRLGIEDCFCQILSINQTNLKLYFKYQYSKFAIMLKIQSNNSIDYIKNYNLFNSFLRKFIVNFD